jgi:hypothetical protein
MLRICPPLFFNSSKAARQTLNVPLRSMSTTVPKPLGDNSSALQRKLPAAPLTAMSMPPKRSTVAATARSTAA